jgi:hypothetical protein
MCVAVDDQFSAESLSQPGDVSIRQAVTASGRDLEEYIVLNSSAYLVFGDVPGMTDHVDEPTVDRRGIRSWLDRLNRRFPMQYDDLRSGIPGGLCCRGDPLCRYVGELDTDDHLDWPVPLDNLSIPPQLADEMRDIARADMIRKADDRVAVDEGSSGLLDGR